MDAASVYREGVSVECRPRYVYDGWNVVLEFDYNGVAAENVLHKTYTWGLEAWEAYFDWCDATDFSRMNTAEIFSALLGKGFELGLPAAQSLPE